MSAVVPEYGFPTKYNENYLVLLVRDPYCMFSYWEFSDEQMDIVAKQFARQWGKITLVLRVYNLTGLNFDGENAHSYFDVNVHSLANNFYIKEISPNNSYCVELGVITSDGRFVALLRSNIVQTPRDSFADGSGIVMADLLDRLQLPEKKDEVEEIQTFSSEGVYIKRTDEEE
jgi:hypothetical protein